MKGVVPSDERLRWPTDEAEWNSVEEYLLFLRQKKAYDHALQAARGKDVLDYGSGGGYGTEHLAKGARRAVGADIDEASIDYCRRRYQAPNLSFERLASLGLLPFPDATFDVVVSFQVIEHVADVPGYLSELKRVVRPEGQILLSTPNRKHRLLPFQKPWNPEHLREYSESGFRRALTQVFGDVQVLGVSATDEITAIEHRRVRQSPVAVYVRRPITRGLKALLSRSVVASLATRRTAASGVSTPAPAPAARIEPRTIERFSLQDYAITPNVVRSLDLFAVCRSKLGSP